MDGRRLHTLAQKLLEGITAGSPLTGGDGAPECRSAISRAYYATFLVVAAFLDRIGFAVENTPAAHTAVQYALNNSRDAVLQGVSTDLAVLSSDRRRADYDVKDKVPERLDHATNVVNRAAGAIAKLDDVRDNAAPDRTGAIAVAISNWLRSAQTAGLRQKSGTG